jgi:DNA topoisomerase I
MLSKSRKSAVRRATPFGLRKITDEIPGIRRLRKGSGFAYLHPTGKLVRSPQTLQRIRQLVIPPAWKDVWICCNPEGHLQATGRDARGRKQYRYHSSWTEQRGQMKYNRLIQFASVLPRLRRRVQRDLREPRTSHPRVLATIVRMLETTLIRVGNEEYARSNGSYGLTTIENRHASVSGSKVQLRFRGKSGVQHFVLCDDARVARVVKRCKRLPGRELFAYLDQNGKARDVKSADVNEYLREATGEAITAKDFRTWAGTLLAVHYLIRFDRDTVGNRRKKTAVKAIEAVAKRLGNTVSVCRKCYIHPAVLQEFHDGTLGDAYSSAINKHGSGLRADEARLVRLLEAHARRARGPRKPHRTPALKGSRAA